MFHGIAQFSTGRSWISFRGDLLKYSFLPKVMNQCPLLHAEMTANCGKILPHRGVLDKLLNESFSVWPGFCEEQNPGGVTIDAMYHESPLPLRFQLCRKKRECR